MNKESISPFKALAHLTWRAAMDNDTTVEQCLEWYEIVADALRALQIIKEKKVDVEQIIENPDMDNVIWYNTSFTGVLCEGWRMLNQEEYDLLREVLL